MGWAHTGEVREAATAAFLGGTKSAAQSVELQVGWPPVQVLLSEAIGSAAKVGRSRPGAWGKSDLSASADG